jgi:hypothetical protein
MRSVAPRNMARSLSLCGRAARWRTGEPQHTQPDIAPGRASKRPAADSLEYRPRSDAAIAAVITRDLVVRHPDKMTEIRTPN